MCVRVPRIVPHASYGSKLGYLYQRRQPFSRFAIPRQELLRKAKFVLAFENSGTKDYVTEKFFHGLEAGAIPVVYRTPNIQDFEPGPHSIIMAEHFRYSMRARDGERVIYTNMLGK